MTPDSLVWIMSGGLFVTCFAAIVILLFGRMIAERPILAFLMPVIAALVGNGGHQALAVTLRGIVLDEVRRDRVSQRFDSTRRPESLSVQEWLEIYRAAVA